MNLFFDFLKRVNKRNYRKIAHFFLFNVIFKIILEEINLDLWPLVPDVIKYAKYGT